MKFGNKAQVGYAAEEGDATMPAKDLKPGQKKLKHMKKSFTIFILLILVAAAKAQKTSKSDWHTRMEANYERGVYSVNITNLTNIYVSYSIRFPDGSKFNSTPFVAPHETIGVSQGSANFIFSGSVVVRPNNYPLDNYPKGEVQINL